MSPSSEPVVAFPWFWAVVLVMLLGLGFGIARLLHAREAATREARGAFEIEMRVKKISAGGFPNTSANPFERREVTEFRVYHRGKRLSVRYPNGEQDDGFWEAWFLDGAPRPALLLATTGIWLVTEQDGLATVETLVEAETGGAQLQWLDGADGQPSPMVHVGIGDARGTPRGHREGSLLLLGRKVLLDTRNLTVTRFRVTDSEPLRQAEEYNAGNADALHLSPGRSQYALLGSRDADPGYDYAIVVADPGRGRAYAVPFERSATRLADRTEANRAWFEHHFTWVREPSGEERLQRRSDAAPWPWLGRLSRSGDFRVGYRLPGAGPGLRAVFEAFIAEHFAVEVLPADPQDPHSTRLRAGGWNYVIRYSERDRSVSFWYDNGLVAEQPAAFALVGEVGEAFNARLASGAHQDQFIGFAE
jgi:hypothetical protein